MVSWNRAVKAGLLVATAWMWMTAGCAARLPGQGRGVFGPEHPHTSWNSTSLTCKRLENSLDKAVDMFRRPLSREEYYRRNFMWLRCRSVHAKYFDVGGSWFGDHGEGIRRLFTHAELVYWNFRYVNGEWGDGVILFYLFADQPLETVVQKFRSLARVSTERYWRNLYIIDCPGAQNDPQWGTERKSVPFPNTNTNSIKEGKNELVTIYNKKGYTSSWPRIS